jgi:hypothetical protein
VGDFMTQSDVLDRQKDASADETTSEKMIYMLGSLNEQKVKIGESKDLPSRLSQHASGDVWGEGGDYLVLAIIRAGGGSQESQIKNYFANYVVKGLRREESPRRSRSKKTEVFYTEGVIGWITWLRDQYFVAISEDEYIREQGSQDIVDFQLWKPTPQRISPRRRVEIPFWDRDIPWVWLPERESMSDDYIINPKVIECVREAFGGRIPLDPAAHVVSNRVVKADTIYTRSMNGLIQPWFEKVWLNPPFGDYSAWVKKALEELPHLDELIMHAEIKLLNVDYFAPLRAKMSAVCFIEGRHRYPFSGVKCSTPEYGHFLMYFGPNIPRFSKAVEKLGGVLVPVK